MTAEQRAEAFQPREPLTLAQVTDIVNTPGVIIPRVNAETCVDERKSHDILNIVSPEQYRDALEAARAATADSDLRDYREMVRIPEFPAHNHDGVQYAPHSPSALQRPGGGFGRAMVVAGALQALDGSQAMEIVSFWNRTRGREEITRHSADGRHGKTGCGHVDYALADTAGLYYKVPGTRVAEMIEYERRMVREQRRPVAIATMKGEHPGGAVIVVNGESETVNPTNLGFLYDAQADEHEFADFAEMLKGNDGRLGAFLDELPEDLRTARNGQSLERYLTGVRGLMTPDLFIRVAAEQTQVTLRKVAPGLPIYTVDLNGDMPVVSQTGNVPQR